ncbi:MAG: hypothetical protein J4432_03725 [DPANN group archaeon]|nr:hypothetical protein [DPANN group archaeon]
MWHNIPDARRAPKPQDQTRIEWDEFKIMDPEMSSFAEQMQDFPNSLMEDILRRVNQPPTTVVDKRPGAGAR